MRQEIKSAVPEAEETISYGIPTFKLNGKYLIYIAGYAKHVAVYPIFGELEKEIPELTKYRSGKATVQFPLDQPIPYELIRKVVEYKKTSVKAWLYNAE